MAVLTLQKRVPREATAELSVRPFASEVCKIAERPFIEWIVEAFRNRQTGRISAKSTQKSGDSDMIVEGKTWIRSFDPRYRSTRETHFGLMEIQMMTCSLTSETNDPASGSCGSLTEE
jgi:hypothetical protein